MLSLRNGTPGKMKTIIYVMIFQRLSTPITGGVCSTRAVPKVYAQLEFNRRSSGEKIRPEPPGTQFFWSRSIV